MSKIRYKEGYSFGTFQPLKCPKSIPFLVAHSAHLIYLCSYVAVTTSLYSIIYLASAQHSTPSHFSATQYSLATNLVRQHVGIHYIHYLFVSSGKVGSNLLHEPLLPSNSRVAITILQGMMSE